MISTIQVSSTNIKLPATIARDVALYGKFADALDIAVFDDGTERPVPALRALVSSGQEVDMPKEMHRAMMIYRGLRAVGTDQFADIYRQSRERVEEYIKNGPAGPTGDDAPESMDWLPGWQQEAGAAWNAILLRLFGSEREAEWESALAHFYLSGCNVSGMSGGSTHYVLEIE